VPTMTEFRCAELYGLGVGREVVGECGITAAGTLLPLLCNRTRGEPFGAGGGDEGVVVGSRCVSLVGEVVL
jgi:hypothetical protein